MSSKRQERDGERLFTQKELESLIAERLMRERKNLEAYKTVKDILCEMMKDGIVNAHSYAEAARELYERLSSENAENTVNNGKDTVPECALNKEAAAEEKTSEIPETADVMHEDFCKDSETRTEDFSDETVEKLQNAEMEFSSLPEEILPDDSQSAATDEMCELMKAYPELCIETLLSDEGFIMYSKRYKGTLKELYEGYKRVRTALGKIGGDNGGETDYNFDRRRMASTSFSRYSASPSSDAGFDLSPLQRDIARRAGLSYREYFEMLREIPDSKKATRR